MTTKNSLIVGALILIATLTYHFTRNTAQPKNPIEQTTQASTKPAKQAMPARGRPAKIAKVQEAKFHDTTKKKVRFNLKTLLKVNPALQDANPGLDLSTLQPDDPRWANVKVPADIPLVALKSGECGRNAITGIGALSDDQLANTLESAQVPSFISYKTNRDQTLGDIESSVQKNDCVLGVFANGPIDTVRLPPGTKSLDGLLDPGTKDAPKFYNVKEIALAGKASFESSAQSGEAMPYQVYMAGSTPDRFGVTANEDASEPVNSGWTMMGGAGEIWFLPFSPDASPSQQIADTNNAILNAIAHGAHTVLVPAVDPNVLLPSSQIAAQYGVTIYEVPRDAQPLPTGLLDEAGAVRLPSSAAYGTGK